MTDTIQSSETAINYGSRGSTVLQKMWVVPPAQTTSKELDEAITNRSESEASNLVGSSTSLRFEKSDILERHLEEYVSHAPFIIREVLEAIGSDVVRLFTGSADISSSVLDDFSTHPYTSAVNNQVGRLFSLATSIDLEPGMANEFSDGLEHVVERHGRRALDTIKRIILNEETASSVAMETLKYIGNTDSKVWQNERRLMLETCLLQSNSVWARDGAGLGLSFLGDLRSISALEQAIKQESSQALRRDLEQILRRLKESTSES